MWAWLPFVLPAVISALAALAGVHLTQRQQSRMEAQNAREDAERATIAWRRQQRSDLYRRLVIQAHHLHRLVLLIESKVHFQHQAEAEELFRALLVEREKFDALVGEARLFASTKVQASAFHFSSAVLNHFPPGFSGLTTDNPTRDPESPAVTALLLELAGEARQDMTLPND